MAPYNVIKNALDNATQIAISLESDSRDLPRRHHKSRFSFFKHPRLKDEFLTDTFYPRLRSVQNQTCAPMFTGKYSGHWELHPMSKESHSLSSLQYFVRNIGIPSILKRDNSRTQTGEKWTTFEHQLCVNGIMIDPKSTCQNKVEHFINELVTMVHMHMQEFNVPLN